MRKVWLVGILVIVLVIVGSYTAMAVKEENDVLKIPAGKYVTEKDVELWLEEGLPIDEAKKIIESTNNNTMPPLISMDDIKRWKEKGVSENSINRILLTIGKGRLPNYDPEVAEKFYANAWKLPTPLSGNQVNACMETRSYSATRGVKGYMDPGSLYISSDQYLNLITSHLGSPDPDTGTDYWTEVGIMRWIDLGNVYKAFTYDNDEGKWDYIGDVQNTAHSYWIGVGPYDESYGQYSYLIYFDNYFARSGHLPFTLHQANVCQEVWSYSTYIESSERNLFYNLNLLTLSGSWYQWDSSTSTNWYEIYPCQITENDYSPELWIEYT
jgi:hypothetical protein